MDLRGELVSLATWDVAGRADADDAAAFADDLLTNGAGSCPGPLAPLADSLSAELEPLIGREIYVPADEGTALARRRTL